MSKLIVTSVNGFVFGFRLKFPRVIYYCQFLRPDTENEAKCISESHPLCNSLQLLISCFTAAVKVIIDKINIQ